MSNQDTRAKLKDFKNWSIASKMRIILGVMLGLTLLIAGAAGSTVYWLSVNSEKYLAGSFNIRQASEMSAEIASTLWHAQEYSGKGRLDELAQARTALKRVQQLITDVRPTLQKHNPESAVTLDPISANLEIVDTQLTLLANHASRGAADGDRAVDTAELSRTGHALEQQVAELKKRLTADFGAFGTYGMSIFYWLGSAFILLTSYAIYNTRVALRHIKRDITGPLEEITESMLKLADGDNKITVPAVERGDEIGDMARSLEVFRRGYLKLEKMKAETEDRNNAEMKRQEEERQRDEEMRQLRVKFLIDLADKFEQSLGDVVGGVAAASSQLQLTASSMAAAAEQSALQTGDVSNALGEASAGVTAAAAASDEFAMSIGEISRQAATSAELARNATNAATEADATIAALSESAQQVGKIVELISMIAQRTNLLALNASIEAARGGEAGRGFAVVASEVKELAARTSKATEEVADQIKAIQGSTGASVHALREIKKQVEQLESTSVSIAAAVDQQSIAGQDLARSIDLAARSADEVASNIIHVRETSLATGAAASQVLTSSTELEEQAVTLKQQAEEFLSHVRAA